MIHEFKQCMSDKTTDITVLKKYSMLWNRPTHFMLVRSNEVQIFIRVMKNGKSQLQQLLKSRQRIIISKPRVSDLTSSPTTPSWTLLQVPLLNRWLLSLLQPPPKVTQLECWVSNKVNLELESADPDQVFKISLKRGISFHLLQIYRQMYIFNMNYNDKNLLHLKKRQQTSLKIKHLHLLIHSPLSIRQTDSNLFIFLKFSLKEPIHTTHFFLENSTVVRLYVF